MRLSGLFYFYRLRLRTRWVQESFALIGIAVGVALVFAAQIANTSMTGSMKQLVGGTFGEATLQVAQPDRSPFDGRTLEEIRAVPGVDVAAPLLEKHATVSGPSGTSSALLMGIDRSLAGLEGRLTRRYRATRLPTRHLLALPEPIVQKIGASVGGHVTISAGAIKHRVRLNLALGASDIGSLTHSPIAITPLANAQDLAGTPGQVTRILIKPVEGETESVRQSLVARAQGRYEVKRGDSDIRQFEQAATPSNQSTALFSAISALVGFLFAFNAMLLTLPDRRRLIVGLRIDGYSPLSVLQILLFDALVLGITATAAGLVLGDVLSRALFDNSTGYLTFAFAVGEQRIVEWQSAAIAVVAGLGSALLAAMLPLQDTLGRKPPSITEEGEPVSQRRALTLLGASAGCFVLSMATIVIAPGLPLPAIGMLVASLMLGLPAAVRGTLALAEHLLLRMRSAVPMISLGELRSMPTRSLALTATGALAVFGSVASQGAKSDLQTGLDRSSHDVNAAADIWVAPGGTPNLLATDPFDSHAEARLRQLPDVRSVGVYRSSFLDLGDRRVWVFAQPRDSAQPIPSSQLVEGDVDQAERRVRAGGWAVVSERIAAERDLHVGSRFTLPAPRPQSLRVAALSTNVGWPPGAIVLNQGDYSRSWSSGRPSAYQVMLRDGVPPEQGLAAVDRALGPSSALTVETGAQREALHRATSRDALSRLNQLSALVLIAAVLAMAAATGGVVWQRRMRLASLKLDGFDELTVWRALLLESALLLGTGCLAGALFGLCGQQLLDRALSAVTGFPVVYSVSIGFAVVSFVLVTAIAVSIAALPGYLAARVSPAVALQE